MNNLISDSEYNAEQVAMQSIQYTGSQTLRNDNDVHCGSQNVSHKECSINCPPSASTQPRSLAHAPLSHHIVNHMLAELFPFLHNLLTQFTDILNLLFVNCIIPHTAYSLGFRCGLLGGHSVGGMKSGVICFSSWIVSLARWEKGIFMS